MEIISFFCKSLEVLIIGSTRILQGDTENENQAKLHVEDTKNQCEICLTQPTRANFRLPSFNLISEGADTIKFF